METGKPASGPLKGLKVLDLATMLAGPSACALLGDFGAEVIKIEHPKVGDALRGHGQSKDGFNLWWKVAGRNKQTLGLYLGDPAGQEIFLKLVEKADIVVESFRPGTLEKWGLGYERLKEANPGVILVRISGFGQTGPYAPRAGYGTLAEAMSGFAAMTGEPSGPPTLPPFGLADGITAVTAAFAATAAVHHRDMTGEGQQIDLSIYEPLVAVLGSQATVYDQLHELPERTGNRSNHNAPRNTYLTSDDKWVAISTSSLSIAKHVLALVGRPDLCDEPWFATGAGRVEHADLLDGLVADWIRARPREEVMEEFTRVNAAVAPIFDISELMDDPHIKARGSFVKVDDPDLGPMVMQEVVARFSETPGQIQYTGRPLGADTDSILLKDLGLDEAYVTELREKGVVG